MYELIIIGGGPAGIAAGVYAGRKKMKSAVIADTFGGQSIVSADIQNFIGIPSIPGYELAERMEEQLRSIPDIEIVSPDKAEKIEKIEGGFRVSTTSGKNFETKTVLMAVGSIRRKLGVPGEKEYDGKGVAYCATCDAPMFQGKRVAVVGGGNAGLEAVHDLMAYASEITLFVRGDAPKGDAITLEAITASPKVKVMTHTEVREISGTKFVEGLTFENTKTGERGNMPVDGVFIEIGWIPNSGLVQGLAEIDAHGEIVVNHKTQQTSCEGIWAAGDVSDVMYKQNNISMGDAVKAVLNIQDYLRTQKK